MAARRIFSLLAPRISQTSLIKGIQESHPSSKPLSRIYEKYTRRFQTLAETSIENPVQHESLTSNPDSGTTEQVSNPTNNETTVTHRVNSNLKVSARHDLVMIFTCKVCETRSIKTVCCESYEKGVVIVRCDGCNNLHLIADRLGWFGEPGSVEEFLAAKGEEVKKGSVDTLNLTLEDLAGMKNLET